MNKKRQTKKCLENEKKIINKRMKWFSIYLDP